MHYGFRIVEDMIDGLSQYMDAHGFRTIDDFRGRAVPNVKDWGDLDLNYKIIAEINDACASAASFATSPARRRPPGHRTVQPPASNGKKNANGMGVHVPRIIEEECVGCNLCALVCPVDNCITMRQVDSGQPPMSWNERTRRDHSARRRCPAGIESVPRTHHRCSNLFTRFPWPNCHPQRAGFGDPIRIARASRGTRLWRHSKQIGRGLRCECAASFSAAPGLLSPYAAIRAS